MDLREDKRMDLVRDEMLEQSKENLRCSLQALSRKDKSEILRECYDEDKLVQLILDTLHSEADVEEIQECADGLYCESAKKGNVR